MSLREAIEVAVRGAEVPAPVLQAAFGEIMEGKTASASIAALLVALRTKGETVGEIVAAARALRSSPIPIRAPTRPSSRNTGPMRSAARPRPPCRSNGWGPRIPK